MNNQEQQKQCRQCTKIKPLSAFHRIINATDGRMDICKECHAENKDKHIIFLYRELGKSIEEIRKENEEITRAREERDKALNEWFQLQPNKCCITCKEIKKADNFGYSSLKEREDGFLEPALHQRCKPCHKAWREKLETLCRLCGKKTKDKDYLRRLYGYSLVGNGLVNIQICCEACQNTFLALPIDQQKVFIHEACNKTYPIGQVIYGLYDPRDNELRNIGRTSDIKRRFREHLRASNPTRHMIQTVEGGKEWYTKNNWIYDLLQERLEPVMKVIKYIDISPQAPEWEMRYILHGMQQGWKLLNIETMNEYRVNNVKTSSVNFLQASFEALVEHGFFRENSLEAFVRKWYEP